MNQGALGSARVPLAGDGVLAIADFSLSSRHTERLCRRGRRNQHARCVRYPINADPRAMEMR